MNFIEKEMQPALEAVKKYIPLSVFIFSLSFLGGVFFANMYPEIVEDSIGELRKAFSFLFTLGPIEMGLFIFFNNTVKVFLFMLLGVLFALPTLFFLILNGWVLGTVVTATYPALGIKGIFMGLCLHGFFELSAMFIGTSLGFWIGVTAYRQAKEGATKIFPLPTSMKSVLFISMSVFFRIILPLLLIAAIIETSIMFFYNHL